MSLLEPFENWSTADWMNLRLFVPDVVAPLIDEEATAQVTAEVEAVKAEEDNEQ